MRLRSLSSCVCQFVKGPVPSGHKFPGIGGPGAAALEASMKFFYSWEHANMRPEWRPEGMKIKLRMEGH